MIAAAGLAAAAAVSLVVSLLELIRQRRPATSSGPRPGSPADERRRLVAGLLDRFGIAQRMRAAGIAERHGPAAILGVHLGCALTGAVLGSLVAPALPGRPALLVMIGLPVAGFLVPQALAERAARRRLESTLASMPDALDLMATASATGRSPTAAMRGMRPRQGEPLGPELARVAADVSVGLSEREALAGLATRLPAEQVAALVATLDRARRHGTPLAEQLTEQAAALRHERARQIGERAERAAPKIQLVVALVLVPSVMLLLAAALLANAESLLAGL